MKQSNKRQVKENVILDAAEKVFFPGGFEKARMEEVAEKSGMSKASLYFYFKSKEDIYMAITHRAFQELINRYYRTIEEYSGQPKDLVLEKILETYLAFSEEHYHYHEALFYYMSMLRNGEIEDTDLRDSIYYKKIKGIQNLPVSIVVEELEEGQRNGTIKSQKPAILLYLTAWAVIAGYVKLSIFGGVGKSSLHFVDLHLWKEDIIKTIKRILKE